MIIVVQRVTSASVSIDSPDAPPVAQIGRGLLAYCGLLRTDVEADWKWCAAKLPHLRILEDAQGKMNLSAIDVKAGLLLIPNFTLAGDPSKGRRPAFDLAMPPEFSGPAFASFVQMVESSGLQVGTGVFRTRMYVRATCDGPITMILDSANRPQNDTNRPNIATPLGEF